MYEHLLADPVRAAIEIARCLAPLGAGARFLCHLTIVVSDTRHVVVQYQFRRKVLFRYSPGPEGAWNEPELSLMICKHN